jgi:transcriptional regulator with XRE-family HTH domain
MLTQGKPIDTRIKDTRMKYGLTQKQVSDLTGVPYRSLQNWEAGVRKCPNYVENMVVTMIEQKFGKLFLIYRDSADDNIEIKGLMVSLNRKEKGKGEKSALEEITDLYGFPANAIVTMGEVVEYLYNKPTGKDGKIIIDDKIKQDIENYYKEYGAK